MKYKIGIDMTYVIQDEVTGIRKYGEGLIESISKMKKDYEIVIFVNDNLKKSFEEKFSQYKIISVKFLLKKSRYTRKVNIIEPIKNIKNSKIKKEKCDIIIYPYINKYVLLQKEQKKIITIHDLIPLDEIEDKTSSKYIKLKKEYLDIVNKTENIITISDYSKRSLMNIKPNYKGKIVVIPNSIEKLKKSSKNVYDIIKTNEPYIFSINSFFKHKNQITLIKAFERIKEKIPHKLVLVGRPELGSPISAYNYIKKYIEEKDLKDRILVLSYISDEDRNALFYNTDLFVTTSMQEGFGRTPVEAAICKVPVISTKETSLPEVTMNEVFYYENATDDKELSEKILEVLNNKPSKEKLEEIANKLERAYSEENISKKLCSFIDEILKK